MSTVKPEPDLPESWSEEAYLSLGDSKDRIGRFARVAAMNRASETVLVVEIISPGNAPVDRTLKRQLYAEAKIDWYQLIEPDLDDYETVSLQLLRREGGEYVTHAEAKHGDKLVSGEPFPLEIDTVALLDF